MKFHALAFSFLTLFFSSGVAHAQETQDASLELLNNTAALNFIHHSNQLEIAESTAALPRLVNDEVRAFASLLIEEHSANEALLETLATNECVALYPFQPATYEVAGDDYLARLEGIEYDKGFLTLQIQGHKRALAGLLIFQEFVLDPEINAFIAETAAAVQRHLERAVALLAGLSLASM